MVYTGKLGQLVISHSMAFDPEYLGLPSNKKPNPLRENYKNSNLYKIVLTEDGEVKVLDNS